MFLFIQPVIGSDLGDIDKLKRQVEADDALRAEWDAVKEKIKTLRDNERKGRTFWENQLKKARNRTAISKAQTELKRVKQAYGDAVDAVLEKQATKGTGDAAALAGNLRRLGTETALAVLVLYIDFGIAILESPLIRRTYKLVLEGKYAGAKAFVGAKKGRMIDEINRGGSGGIVSPQKLDLAERTYNYFRDIIF